MDQLNDARKALAQIWWAGVHAVGGRAAVLAALRALAPPKPDRIIAVGKAAPAMFRAATDFYGPDTPGLVITKYGHSAKAGLPAAARVMEAAHPLPDENSLKAGAALLDEVQGMGPGEHLLFLASGGASSLVEMPTTGRSLSDVIAHNKKLLASGLDIHAMNAERRAVSQIKGGQLLAQFRGSAAVSLAISDVEGDDLNVIGSGIGSCAGTPKFDFSSHIVASNAIARAAAAAEADRLGLPVLGNEETLYGDVNVVAARLGTVLRSGTQGVRIWGGEPTVVLPVNPGQGGRNQCLALLLAQQIAGMGGLSVVVAGTDGTDGPTDAAGAFADGSSWHDAEARAALEAANSGAYFEARGGLFFTGPTGTNVMDLAIAWQK